MVFLISGPVLYVRYRKSIRYVLLCIFFYINTLELGLQLSSSCCVVDVPTHPLSRAS